MSRNEKSRSIGGVIEAAGGLLWKTAGDKRLLALVHRPKYDDWTLPKGWREKGEDWEQTAVREVREETNCTVEVLDFAGCSCYLVGKVPKIVLYWNMEMTEERDFNVNHETDALDWMTRKKALKRLSYASERQLIKKS